MTDVKPDVERIGVTRRSIGMLYRNMSGLLIAGIIGAVITVVLAIWGVQISGFDPAQQSLADRLLPPGTDGHIFGTDQLGRDVFARVAVGFRWSVPVGILSAALACSIGVVTGLLAAWNTGWIRSVLTRLMDVAISFPYLVLAVAIVSVVGHGFWALVFTLGLVSWVSFARVVYAETLKLKEREYLIAARLIGNSTFRIISRYLARGLRHTVAVMYAFIFADLLVAEAGLSFLGLGAPLGEPSWGNMLATSREYLFIAPWMMYVPAAAVILVVLTANLLGDGLIERWGRGTIQN
jgi:peptide/nickel transport system permease protein